MKNWLGVLLAVAFLGVLLDGVTAGKTAGCGKTPTIKDGGNYTLTINNKSRWYIVKLPNDYDFSQPYRLIFTLHALGGNAGQVVAGQGGYLPWYDLPPLANYNSIFISPNGLNEGWANSGGEDILLIDAILAAVEADLCVDTSLRFSTGFSYGAALSYAIACSRAKNFRAVAALSGGTMSGC